jgi:hypothetical protein
VEAGEINVSVEEYVCLSDPYVTNEICAITAPVTIDPEEITGEHLFNFEIDLSQSRCEIPLKCKDPMAYQEDYVGVNFGVKHALKVTIARPWYTFPVVHYRPIAIYDPVEKPAYSIGNKYESEDDLEHMIQTEIHAMYLANEISGDLTPEDSMNEEAIRSKFIVRPPPLRTALALPPPPLTRSCSRRRITSASWRGRRTSSTWRASLRPSAPSTWARTARTSRSPSTASWR